MPFVSDPSFASQIQFKNEKQDSDVWNAMASKSWVKQNKQISGVMVATSIFYFYFYAI